MAEGSMTVEEIKKILPHRYPFLLLDRVLEKSYGPDPKSRKGNRVRAIKNVTVNEPFFCGHFPQEAIMPGVLILEVIAQACAIASSMKSDPPMKVAIGRVGEARFHRPVVPGDQLVLDCEVLKDKGKMLLMSGRVTVADQLVTETDILAYLAPREN